MIATQTAIFDRAFVVNDDDIKIIFLYIYKIEFYKVCFDMIIRK